MAKDGFGVMVEDPKKIDDTKLSRQERFASPVTEDDILKKIKDAVPSNTRTTEWCVKAGEDWRKWRESGSAGVPPQLDFGMSNKELSFWLPHFIVGVHTQKGNYYNGGSLYGICAGIQRYIREKRVKCNNEESIDIYKDSSFAYFRSIFDSVLKDLHKKGIEVTKKQAEVIPDKIEEQLWSENILGSDTPQQLLDTLIHCFGLNLALRSRKEHRSLKPEMFRLIKEPCGIQYLLYTEWGSKNHAGGLVQQKVKNKSVKIFTNNKCPERCVVKLYEKYMSLGQKMLHLMCHLLDRPCHDCGYT